MIHNTKDVIEYIFIYLYRVILLVLSEFYLLKFGEGLSASNFSKEDTSETIRNNVKQQIEKILLYNKVEKSIKEISVHVNRHKRIDNRTDLGYYLSGYLDSNCQIIDNNMVIQFNNDYSHLFFIKKKLGYGSVIKGSRPKLVINPNGIPKVLSLINNKIHNIKLYYQIMDYIKLNNLPIKFKICSVKTNKSLTNNYWLAGYLDANSRFEINYNWKPDNFLNVEFYLKVRPPKNDLNDQYILNLIQSNFKGTIKTKNNNLVYTMDNMKSIWDLIKYFRRYQLMSEKYLSFVFWRKSYIRVQNILAFLHNGNPILKDYSHNNEINKLIKYANRLATLNNNKK